MKSGSWLKKVVHDLLSNGFHQKGNDVLLKVDKMYSLLRIPLEMVIGQQMKEEGRDQNH